MLLYTVQPDRQERGENSTADVMGLSDYLGYQPMFCTPVNEDSLEDFWFRAWSAAPRRPERILLIRTTSATPVPMDVIAWTNAMGLHREGLLSDPSFDVGAILREGDPIATDYLLPPDGDGYEVTEVPIWEEHGTDFPWLSSWGKAAPVMRDRVRDIREACYDKISSGAVSVDGKTKWDITYESMYGMYTYSAMMPLLWSMMTRKALIPQVLWVVPQTFERCYDAITRAQIALQAWDDSIANQTETDITLLRFMRRDFASALAAALNSVVSDYVSVNGLGRNDPCFCGSGRKLKKCHGRVSSADDAIIR